MQAEKNILERAKIESGLSYTDLEKRIGFDHTTIFRAVKDPARVTLPTFSVIARHLGIKKAEAINLWREEQAKKLQRRIDARREKLNKATT